jgi:hypothetical protein
MPMRTIHRLLPLLELAACARQPRVAAVPPPPSADAGARLPIRITLGMDPVPGQRIVYVVDGVEHTDSAFRALGLGPDDIVSITVPGTDNEFAPVRPERRVITIRTRRAPPPPADSTPPSR